MIEPYENFLEIANIAEWNAERRAFFYIIGNNPELLEISEKIYDFKSDSLRFYENENNESGLFTGEEDFKALSSTAKRLLRVAVALYNGQECDLFDLFAHLDQEGYQIVSKAIEIRFNFLSSFQYQFEKKKSEELGKYKSQIVELINENREDLKKLNISKICRILEINRTTFYNYELDKFYKKIVEDLPLDLS